LNAPAQRIEVSTTVYNNVFLSPNDYNKIAINGNARSPFLSYKIANLEL